MISAKNAKAMITANAKLNKQKGISCNSKREKGVIKIAKVRYAV